MSRCLSFAILSLTLTSALAVPASGQRSRFRLISASAPRQLGLEIAWSTRAELAGGRGEISSTFLFIDQAQTYDVIEVVYEGNKENFSPRDLDYYGAPMGEEAAQRKAEDRVETLKALERQPKLEHRSVPQVILYVQTNHGALHSIDGESGRTRWAVQVGRSDFPTTEPAANAQFIATVNGSQLYLLDAADGRIAWQRRLGGAPNTGPAISRQWVYVPLVTGLIEAYPVDEPTRKPRVYKSIGRALVPPTISPKTVSWTTDRGYLYVAAVDASAMLFRFETGGSIAARSTYAEPGVLYITSLDGYVYAVDESTGNLRWRFSSGESFNLAAVPIEQSVYVTTEHAGMYSLAADTGDVQWWIPQVRQFLAAGSGRIYGLGSGNRLVVIDASTGAWQGSLRADGLDLFVTNMLTDRIYVGTSAGQIQCLHDARLDWPVVHVKEAAAEEKAPPSITPPPPPREESKPGQETPLPEDDPFGATDSASPFGKEPAPAAPAPEPAGKDDNPFGGNDQSDPSGGAGGDDPFGAGDDPFR